MILRRVRITKTVKAKYRTKNNITDPASLFLNTTKNSSARINDNNILTPSAISVEKTFFSGFVFCPKKKIIRAANEIRVNPPVSKRRSLEEMRNSEIPLTDRNIATMSRLYRMSRRYCFKALPVIILFVSDSFLYYEPHGCCHAQQGENDREHRFCACQFIKLNASQGGQDYDHNHLDGDGAVSGISLKAFLRIIFLLLLI
jgi:hypothetical protein